MELKDFIKKVEEEFDALALGSIAPDKDFRNLLEWSSMNALLMMALIKSETGITVSAEELKQCSTIRELHSMVIKHIAASRESSNMNT